MDYLVIKVKSGDAPGLEEELASYEIDGVEILNPQDRMYYDSAWEEDEAPGRQLGDEAVFKIYAQRATLEELTEHFSQFILQHHYEKSEEKDWNALWAQQFKGIKAGKIFVRPPWVDKIEDYTDIIIEPGMAFGTGSHETTILSLIALADYLKPEDSVYDVGTGSGILAILAKKLGAAFVEGIEIDEKALENSRLNTKLNKVNISFSQGDLLKNCDKKSDLIVANILPPILKRMRMDAHRLLKPQGILLLSGILEKRVEEVLEEYGKGFSLIENRSLGQWHVLILQRQ